MFKKVKIVLIYKIMYFCFILTRYSINLDYVLIYIFFEPVMFLSLLNKLYTLLFILFNIERRLNFIFENNIYIYIYIYIYSKKLFFLSRNFAK